MTDPYGQHTSVLCSERTPVRDHCQVTPGLLTSTYRPAAELGKISPVGERHPQTKRMRVPMNEYPPVRKIGVQSRSLTGTMPDGNRYESSLERDFIELLQGDPDFKRYHAQPVVIDLQPSARSPLSRYVPDGLIFWKSARRPWLVEVKYRADCTGQFTSFLRKFREARRYAKERGWAFHVMTEDRIRGPRLLNVRFLSRYALLPECPVMESAILQSIRNGKTTPRSVIDSFEGTEDERAQLLTQLWRLVANDEVVVSHRQKLTMATPLSIPRCDA